MKKLTSLDLSANTELETLSCYWNVFESLNLTNNTQLKTLYYSADPYNSKMSQSLDFSKNTLLETFTYSYTEAETLDVSHLTNLQHLVCTNNPSMTEILFGDKNTNLTELECNTNKLTSLDLSKLTNLTKISCYDNQLSTLDISRLSKLSTESWNVEVGNQKDKSIEYEYTDLELTLTLTASQDVIWTNSWGSNNKNYNVKFNVLSNSSTDE